MNRNKVLWPLLLAAAFTLGVLAAQVQAGAIFLPLVANAWDGEPVATPPPTGTVRVKNVHYYASRYEMWGELVNNTPCTVTAWGVRLYLLDVDRLPVADARGYSLAPILLPGERTPFRAYWYAPLPAWDSYVAVVHWDPVDRLTIDSAVFTKDEYGACRVTATVRNQLPVRVGALSVGLVLYGPSGQVVGYDDPWERLGPLSPGDTLEVAHTFRYYDWDTSVEPVACAAFAVPCGGSLYSLMEQEPSPTPTPG